MKKHEKIIIEKIKTYSLEALQFKGDITFEQFTSDRKTITSCVFNLSQIGELIRRLDLDFIEMHNHIPWHQIKGLRNQIVHDYEGLQLKRIWEILTIFLPELITNLENLL